MANPAFKRIELELHPPGCYRAIGTAMDAARALLELWPYEKQKGKSYERACQACIDAMDNGGPPEAVRRAFVEAARSAGIMIRKKGR
jgi:hypothetical protein